MGAHDAHFEPVCANGQAHPSGEADKSHGAHRRRTDLRVEPGVRVSASHALLGGEQDTSVGES